MPPGSVATESYLIVGPFSTETEASNAAAYLRTRFVRFLVASILLTQNITRSMFEFVPLEDFSRAWSDAELYEKYGLSTDEVEFIDATIRPLDAHDE
jgi:site-specific DNA-methyltransferase (adenine-specific)